ncbi:MAG: VWA domain-containing protein [Acidobacteria bacterium]|nr:VWA domain-containing protein [Acidobacteriota bacterium]
MPTLADLSRFPTFALSHFRGFAVLLFALSLPAQQSPPTFSSDVNVVNILAGVRSKKGEPVRDLTQQDFTLQVDGRPEAIKYFTHDTDLPLTLGLLIDTSMSMRSVLPEERTASRAFFDQVVREDRDSAFLIHFDREVELLQDLTSSRQKLESALQALDTPELRRSGSSGDPGGDDRDDRAGRSSRRGGGTALYDAVYLASNDVLAAPKGRKAVVLISDGQDRGSKESLEQAIEAAQRSNVIVYSVLLAEKDEQRDFNPMGGGGRRGGGGGWPGGGGVGWPGGGGRGGGMGRPGGGGYPGREHLDGKKIMERLARETGGRMFEASKKQPIDRIYSQIQDELRNQYSLGFVPTGDALAAGYHKLQLTAKNKDDVVQAREGYYGKN